MRYEVEGEQISVNDRDAEMNMMMGGESVLSEWDVPTEDQTRAGIICRLYVIAFSVRVARVTRGNNIMSISPRETLKREAHERSSRWKVGFAAAA